MGDISNEPSMEEILSSIKRIIAEEGDAAISARARRGTRPAPVRGDPLAADGDEVLELSDPVRDPEPVRTPPRNLDKPMAMGAPTPSQAAAQPVPQPAQPVVPEPAAEPLLSDRTAQATRGKLEALSRMVVKPETPGSDSLEGLVRELLKPMLREWLDTNLPEIVEAMVAREISRLTERD